MGQTGFDLTTCVMLRSKLDNSQIHTNSQKNVLFRSRQREGGTFSNPLPAHPHIGMLILGQIGQGSPAPWWWYCWASDVRHKKDNHKPRQEVMGHNAFVVRLPELLSPNLRHHLVVCHLVAMRLHLENTRAEVAQTMLLMRHTAMVAGEHVALVRWDTPVGRIEL